MNDSTEIIIGDVSYRLVPLEPNLVGEFRIHAINDGAKQVKDFSPQRRRSLVQLCLRYCTSDALPFCGPAGGLALETVTGEDTLIDIGQGIADAHDIFDSGARTDEPDNGSE
jgi:hypothetical protein